jgi:hypothetical protein
MDPNADTSPMMMLVQVQHKFGIIPKSHWPRIKIDPGLFRFASQVGFNRLLGLHHPDREREDGKRRSKINPKQKIQVKRGRLEKTNDF